MVKKVNKKSKLKVTDPKGVFIYAMNKWFSWLVYVMREDVNQEIELFVHEVNVVREIKEVWDKPGGRKSTKDVESFDSVVYAARLRLRHIASRYGCRHIEDEKVVIGGVYDVMIEKSKRDRGMGYCCDYELAVDILRGKG